MTTLNRMAARVALVAYVVFLLFVLFQPRPEVAVGSVVRVADLLAQLPYIGPRSTPGRVEFLLNIFAFAPASFLGRWAFPSSVWSAWVAWGFMGSVAVELIQGLYLADRSAQFADIVANTAGSLLGVTAFTIVVWAVSHSRKPAIEYPTGVGGV